MSYGPDPDSSDSDDSYDMNYESIRKNNQPTKDQIYRNELEYFYNVITQNDVKGLLELLNKGFKPDTILREGWTPLILASSFGYCKMVQILLEHGANINQNKDAVTPLMFACSCLNNTNENVTDVVKLLINKGANVQAVNRRRKNALMFAAGSGNLSAVQYILPLSQKQAFDNQGWNALTWAIRGNHLDVVKYLISQNFSLDIVDVRGNSLYEIARENEYREIMDLLPEPKVDTTDNFNCHIPYEEDFQNCTNYKPAFLNEIINILYSINCEYLLPVFQENNITLEEFLSLKDEEMQQMGIKMPIQRYKILDALYKFHYHPFSSNSIHNGLKRENLSNKDAAIQLMSAVYQITAMNGSIQFILKNVQNLNEEEKQRIFDVIQPIKRTLHVYKRSIKKIDQRFCEWDKLAEAPDLITKESIKSTFPWKKIIISCSFLGCLFYFVKPKLYIL